MQHLCNDEKKVTNSHGQLYMLLVESVLGVKVLFMRGKIKGLLKEDSKRIINEHA